MRLRAQDALVFALFLAVVPGVLSAQQIRSRSEPLHRTATQQSSKPVTPRLITADEGLAILGAALESRHHRHIPGNADCSHLVHDIYERAGFSYPYAPSVELYSGVEAFRRITRAQPGDLVVWRGHVGIVINPTQHSFFSALRSGKGVEKYDSAYWKRRGRPHFFRYVKATPPSVLAASTQVATLSPASLPETDQDDPPPEVANPNPEHPVVDAQSTASSESQPGPVALPRVQIINSARPTPEQVRAALLETFNATGEALRGQDVFKLTQSLIVFDSFEVKKIHLKGDEGWAEVRISGPSSVIAGHANLKKHSERQHWGLSRRDHNSWELALPADAVYLPRALAVRILAHELASLADTGTVPAPPDDKKTQLAHMLDVLLGQPASP